MGLAEWVVAVVGRLGYAGVALLVALESVVPPLPSEVVLPMAGFAVAQGRLSLGGVVLSATLGSLAGALVLYAVGRRLGEERLRDLVERRGRFVLLYPRDVDRATAWFRRHGGKSVLVGRLAPGVRSLVSVPAGVAAMPLPRFVAFTAVGSLAWNALLVLLGRELGARWRLVEPVVDAAGWTVWALVALVAALLVLHRRRAGRAA